MTVNKTANSTWKMVAIAAVATAIALRLGLSLYKASQEKEVYRNLYNYQRAQGQQPPSSAHSGGSVPQTSAATDDITGLWVTPEMIYDITDADGSIYVKAYKNQVAEQKAAGETTYRHVTLDDAEEYVRTGIVASKTRVTRGRGERLNDSVSFHYGVFTYQEQYRSLDEPLFVIGRSDWNVLHQIDARRTGNELNGKMVVSTHITQYKDFHITNFTKEAVFHAVRRDDRDINTRMSQ